MKKEYICVCGKKFKSVFALSGHKANCKDFYLQRDGNLNNYYNRQKNLKLNANNKNANKQRIKNNQNRKKEKIEQWKKEEHRCECCGKIMTEYYGSGRFCSKSCANSRKHSEKTKEKISTSISLHKKLYICKNCNKFFWSSKKSNFCSDECKNSYNNYIKLKNKYLKIIKQLYFEQCKFKFNILDFPELFDINLLTTNGMYSASNRGNNYNGVSRDHRYSKINGFKNNIDPYYISHPCNCQLILHKDNLNKRTKNSISFEELLNEINNFNNIYGEYPNIIDYTGFYFYVK